MNTRREVKMALMACLTEVSELTEWWDIDEHLVAQKTRARDRWNYLAKQSLLLSVAFAIHRGKATITLIDTVSSVYL